MPESTLISGARVIGSFKNAPADKQHDVQQALDKAAGYALDEQLAYSMNADECEKRGLKP